jgi:fibronectin-binding autotransporter adhesin
MKLKSFRGLASALSIGALSSISFTGRGDAATYTKADNTTALNLAASWGGTVPGAADTANWSGTYNTAGSLAAALPAATLTWQGITAGGISGTAAGPVSIGGTGAAVVGSILAVGSSGINMTGANQDLVVNAGTLTLNGSQTWTVPAGRNLRLGSTAMSSNVDGAGGGATVITVAGGGVVDANQGAANGFADYTGKWIVGSGATLRGVQNGTGAWGSNTSPDAILLNGGKLAVGGMTGAAGNWTWSTPITLGTGTTSTVSGQNPDTSTRTLTLQSPVSGDGNLIFEKPSGGTLRVAMERDDNAFTGNTTINGSGVGITANLTVQGLLGVGAGVKTPLGTGDITVNSGATMEFRTAAASTATVNIANNINLNNATLRCSDALQTYNGTIALTGVNTILGSVDQKHTAFDGSITGAGSVTIRSLGTQQMILGFPNSYTGGTILGNNTSNDGIVVLGDPASLGTGPLTLRGAQIRASVADLTLSNPLTIGQTGTGGGLCAGGSNNIAFTSPAVVDNASRPFLNSGTGTVTLGNIDLTSGTSAAASFGSATARGPFNVTGPITGSGKVEVKGGTVTLAGTSSYAGTTAISTSGQLNLTGSLVSNITMTGANASIKGAGSTTGSLTTSGTNGGTILLDPANPTLAISANAVNFSGATKVDLLNQQALGTTVYTVVKYGSLAGLANLTSSALRASFSDDAVNKKVTLSVTSANRTWNQAASAIWNLTDNNWVEGDNKYFNGDGVTFGNVGAGIVTVSGIVTPYSVTFNNSAGSDYTLNSSNNNQISGPTGLTKSGGGTVTLVGENKFTGKVVITGGVLAVRADNSLGAAPANLVADQITLNGGTLKLEPSPANNLAIGANRGITLGAAGGIIDASAVTSQYTGTIAGDIVGNGPLVIFANGDTSDTGGGVPGATALTGFSTFTGPVTIKSGVVTIDSWFGDFANVVTLDGGGLVDQNINVSFGQDIQIGAAGGVLRSYGNATTSFTGSIANAPGVADASIRRTDGGTQIFIGSGAGFQGTFTNSRGITNFDSEDWSGMNLVNTDGGQVRFRSGFESKVKSIATDVDLFIEAGTILNVTSGNITVQPGLNSNNFWLQGDGSLTSSSGTLNFNFLTPYTAAGADDQSVRVLIEDYQGAPVQVVKNGPGGMNNFDRSNTYTGGTIINGGRISVQNGDAFGFGTVTINSGGQAYLGLVAANFNNPFIIEGNGPPEPAGNLGALRFVNNTVSGDVTIGAAGARIVGYGGDTGTINGEIKGAGNLEINSSTASHNGTITLNGPSSSYTGTITVAQGRLNVENAQSGTVTVADGANLGGEGILSGTLNLGVTTGANLRVLGATEFSLETQNLALKGINNVHLDSMPVTPGPVTLVKYATLTSGGIANLQMAPGSTVRTTFNDTGSAIELNIITENRTWAGTVNGNWNSTDLNWVGGDQKFYTGDTVTFNDSAATRTVVIPSPVSPAAVLFDNSTGNNYTVTGRMIIPASGSLVKQGTGSVTLAGTPSAIDGLVQIDGGMLVLATTDYQRAVGLSTGIVVNSGILRLNGINVLYDGAGSTDITVNAGGVVELNAYHNHFRNLYLNGGTLLGIRSDADTRYNNEYTTFDTLVTVGGTQMSTITRPVGASGVYALAGAPFIVEDVTDGTDLLVNAPLIGGVLDKDGAGTMALNFSNSYTGGTLVNGGTLLANNASGSATGTGTVVVAADATLGGTGAVSGAVTVESGGKLAPGVAIESLGTGPLSLTAGSIFAAEIHSSGIAASDVVDVTGNVTLAGSLTLTDIAGAPAGIPAGVKLTLINYTGTLAGTFAGLPEEASVSAGANTFKTVNILVTAGPTREPIDPVRFLSNRSSGKMGYEIAAAFARAATRFCWSPAPPPSMCRMVSISCRWKPPPRCTRPSPITSGAWTSPSLPPPSPITHPPPSPPQKLKKSSGHPHARTGQNPGHPRLGAHGLRLHRHTRRLRRGNRKPRSQRARQTHAKAATSCRQRCLQTRHRLRLRSQ